jgi:hypothetical protein
MAEKGSADGRRSSWGVELGSMDRRTRFQVSRENKSKVKLSQSMP